jgi:hypothetical protein
VWHGKEYKIFSFLLLKFMSMSGKKKKKKKKKKIHISQLLVNFHTEVIEKQNPKYFVANA